MAAGQFQRGFQQGLVEQRARLRRDFRTASLELVSGPAAQRGGPVIVAGGRGFNREQRQVGGEDLAARGHYGEAAAQVLELAHVAGPVVARELFQGARGEAFRFQVQFARVNRCKGLKTILWVGLAPLRL